MAADPIKENADRLHEQMMVLAGRLGIDTTRREDMILYYEHMYLGLTPLLVAIVDRVDQLERRMDT